MDPLQNAISAYLTVSIITTILVIVWMVMIVTRLGRIVERLTSIDRRLAYGPADQGQLPQGAGPSWAGMSQVGGQSTSVAATYWYQGMKVEEAVGGGFVLHSPDGFEHFSSRRDLESFLQKNYPSNPGQR